MRLLDRLLPGTPIPQQRIANAPVDGALVRESLSRHGRFTLTARGGSMNPAVPDGSVVVVEPAAFSLARYGEIVMATYGGTWHVIHRIVGRDRRAGMLLTKGDSLDGLDPPVDEAMFLGRVAGYSRGARRVALDKGLMRRAGPLLATLSIGSLALVAIPVRVLRGIPWGTRIARLLARVARGPAWVLAWVLVRLSARPCGPRSSGRGTDRSDDRLP
ncbi:MAG: S24/S26 family peptidase [Candidatus Eisenbacteria bacterium]|nr:S24/S26 family peptidase [Candidatus Eisenbacteria bacterium]